MMADSSNPNSSNPTVNGDNPNQDAINNVVPKNTAEIIWIKAGIENGKNKELKAHAKMMLVDHENLALKIKKLIAKKSYIFPSFDTANTVTINDKKGADWD